MKWSYHLVKKDGVITEGHIFPVKDDGTDYEKPHIADAAGMCWCNPRLNEVDEDVPIYLHNAPN
jgi:hypothetical protein